MTDRSVDLKEEAPGERLSGVNRLLPLAVCPNIPETHHNLRQIMEHLKLHKIKNMFIVMDLCLLNVVLGISSHGGRHSCAFCDGTSTLKSGNLRTFGHLSQKYQEYLAAGANPAHMKNFANVTQECLIAGHPSQKILDVIPLPELHLLMGVVNHLLKLIINYFPDILDILKHHNIFHHGYQCGWKQQLQVSRQAQFNET